MSTVPAPVDLAELPLEAGGHTKLPWEDGGGGCAVEKTALWIRYGVPGLVDPHPEQPFDDRCAGFVSPVIGAYMRALNDRLADGPRQLLDPYTVKIIGAAWAAGAARDAARRVEKNGGDWYEQRNAARDVARPIFDKALEPISAGLRESAFQLLDRMIEVGKQA